MILDAPTANAFFQMMYGALSKAVPYTFVNGTPFELDKFYEMLKEITYLMEFQMRLRGVFTPYQPCAPLHPLLTLLGSACNGTCRLWRRRAPP